jgi:hypothetical protein
MKEIPLSQGYFAIVDDDDYPYLSKYSWFAYVKEYGVYAIRNYKDKDGRHTTIRMHREVARTPKGLCTDHRNRNTLDNRKENLRIATKQQNGRNRSKIKVTQSRYKGVSLQECNKRWLASISIMKKRISIGWYDSEIEAAKAYDAKAKELFGEWARPNFPDAITGADAITTEARP